MLSYDGTIPSGALKDNHVSEIYNQSVANTVFAQFAQIESGFGKKSGESVTIPRASDIDEPDSTEVSEWDNLPEDSMDVTQKVIRLKDRGRAITMSARLDERNEFSVPKLIEKKLAEQMALGMDTVVAAAFKNAKIKYIPTGASSRVIDDDGTPSTTATANLNFYHAKQIRDLLAGTYLVPELPGGGYVIIGTTKALRGIKDDANFTSAKQYMNRDLIFKGEIGEIEGIRFVECNHAKALSNSKGSGGVLGEFIAFGADSVAMVMAMKPEIRYDFRNYKRFLGFAWVADYNADLIWDTANVGEAKVIHGTSA